MMVGTSRHPSELSCQSNPDTTTSSSSSSGDSDGESESDSDSDSDNSSSRSSQCYGIHRKRNGLSQEYSKTKAFAGTLKENGKIVRDATVIDDPETETDHDDEDNGLAAEHIVPETIGERPGRPSIGSDSIDRRRSRPQRNVSIWDENFQMLVKFKMKHGNFPVFKKDNPEKDGPELRLWCSQQRSLYKKNKLPAHKKQLLDAIGFRWGPRDDDWMKMYNELITYTIRHKMDPATMMDKQLRKWIAMQRFWYTRNRLRPDRVDLLNKIGFVWDVSNTKGCRKDDSWMNHYRLLLDYAIEHKGQTRITKPEKRYKKLEFWCWKQRSLYAKNSLARYRMDLLNRIRFDWNIHAPQAQQTKTKTTTSSSVF